MKVSRRWIALLIVLLVPVAEAPAYRLVYREQLYRLYHRHFYQTPERIAENVYWLEQTLRSDFANPLNALATIGNDKEWEWYRSLFSMHVNLLLVDLYLQWGNQYMKHEAYFYNRPWTEENLRSLDRAEEFFTYARRYWDAADRFSAAVAEVRWLHLEEIQKWEDEHHRIRSGELDYGEIIDTHLDHVARVRAAFEAMGPVTE